MFEKKKNLNAIFVTILTSLGYETLCCGPNSLMWKYVWPDLCVVEVRAGPKLCSVKVRSGPVVCVVKLYWTKCAGCSGQS